MDSSRLLSHFIKNQPLQNGLFVRFSESRPVYFGLMMMMMMQEPQRRVKTEPLLAYEVCVCEEP